jgi:hypothetical protein
MVTVRDAPPGALRISPATGLDFGVVASGMTATRTLELRNAGAQPIRIDGLDVASDELSLAAPPLPLQLGPSEVLRVALTFRPLAMGMRATTLTVRSTAPGAPAQVVLVRGRGASGEALVFADGFEGRDTVAWGG